MLWVWKYWKSWMKPWIRSRVRAKRTSIEIESKLYKMHEHFWSIISLDSSLEELLSFRSYMLRALCVCKTSTQLTLFQTENSENAFLPGICKCWAAQGKSSERRKAILCILYNPLYHDMFNEHWHFDGNNGNIYMNNQVKSNILKVLYNSKNFNHSL